jgi:predicted AlkP superfamily pyrophosphatase or phosphodiesterase
MFACLGELLQETLKRSRYIYAYYPDLDSCSHHYGTDSRQAQQTLSAVDTLFGELLRKLRGSNTWVLVTADHGFIDSPPPSHQSRRPSAARRTAAPALVR